MMIAILVFNFIFMLIAITVFTFTPAPFIVTTNYCPKAGVVKRHRGE